MRILTPRQRVEPPPYYLRCFDWAGHTGWGFSFECDEHGNVAKPKYDEGAENLLKCLNGEYDVVDRGAVRCQNPPYSIPAVGLCDCGRKVELEGFTNTCECGADYNSCGQRLAPREQWGEETGESVHDILRIR